MTLTRQHSLRGDGLVRVAWVFWFLIEVKFTYLKWTNFKCTIQWHLLHPSLPSSKHFHHPQKQSFPSPPSLLAALICFTRVSLWFTYWDISDKWDHTIWPFVSGLFHLTRFQGSFCSRYQYFIPISGWIFHCVDIPHFVYLFIIDGHLGYSLSLAIVNCAAINIRVWVLVWITIFNNFGWIPRTGVAG